ncbi:hydroxymethylglutaryl-CoA reductase [Mangrovibacterium diazotrophicum]|uniref:3-hydroxy-3-methylglutaryl-coenzyme A reductase n=1 Tax=Mangrovibacterium diazotrophicum TaxID=1261403 RepID=A0A419W809_9BACT|nr:hydroxymethylglutaryl-CoA reductase [Mangrovibacterium diazotrophicum]RKD91621.1 3-hydroxy-3-methylglutaryl-coenzyme A reductase [Mangrovibacterium diazotrophicum]
MKDNKPISGFSKLSKNQKTEWLIQQLGLATDTASFLADFESKSPEAQAVIADLSENHLSNFHFPFSVAPNFLVNGQYRVLPFVTEESSVVAALGKAAGFWAKRGGFHAEILGTEKKGQLHFSWKGDPEKIKAHFNEIEKRLRADAAPITQKMEKRGGGISTIELKYLPEILPDYYQLDVAFETRDAMGANFINSCLEQFGKSLKGWLSAQNDWSEAEQRAEIIMAILSNYVPDSRVRVWVECPVEELSETNDADAARNFAEKFVQAVHISRNDVSRAVTHNKGIFNGVDALALATGNDFRAIEAGGHAFAARKGEYAGLSEAKIEDGIFTFSMELSLAVGVVGGVTALHPMAKLAMQILEHPSAEELMQYLAIAGLASNWSAVRALVTTGIQQGHMKMHLSNILNTLGATDEQKAAAKLYFEKRDVSFSDVEQYLKNDTGR